MYPLLLEETGSGILFERFLAFFPQASFLECSERRCLANIACQTASLFVVAGAPIPGKSPIFLNEEGDFMQQRLDRQAYGVFGKEKTMVG